MARETEEVLFCLKVDFDKKSDRPERVFDGIAGMIRSFQELDHTLINCVDGEIKPVLMLENIEAGSIKVWLRQQLEKIPDSAIKDGEIKKAIGHFLVDAKYALIQYLDERTTLSDRADVQTLEQKILDVARETKVNQLDCYHSPKIEGLLDSMQKISAVAKNMGPKDRIAIIDSKGNALAISGDFDIPMDTLENMITSETMTSNTPMILKVKQPDFLGEAQWKFKFGPKTIDAKILDEEWLQDYHSRKFVLQPGDSIRAMVHCEVAYGYNNEPIRERYEVKKVLDVLPVKEPSMTILEVPGD